MKSDEVDAANAARALLANPALTPYRPSTCQKKAQELTRHYQRLRVQLKANEMALKQASEGPSSRYLERHRGFEGSAGYAGKAA